MSTRDRVRSYVMRENRLVEVKPASITLAKLNEHVAEICKMKRTFLPEPTEEEHKKLAQERKDETIEESVRRSTQRELDQHNHQCAQVRKPLSDLVKWLG